MRFRHFAQQAYPTMYIHFDCTNLMTKDLCYLALAQFIKKIHTDDYTIIGWKHSHQGFKFMPPFHALEQLLWLGTGIIFPIKMPAFAWEIQGDRWRPFGSADVVATNIPGNFVEPGAKLQGQDLLACIAHQGIITTDEGFLYDVLGILGVADFAQHETFELMPVQSY